METDSSVEPCRKAWSEGRVGLDRVLSSEPPFLHLRNGEIISCLGSLRLAGDLPDSSFTAHGVWVRLGEGGQESIRRGELYPPPCKNDPAGPQPQSEALSSLGLQSP